MDEKLAAMAKSTVFARCTRRELTRLGSLLELAELDQGAALPSGGPGRWLHLVLAGRALGVFEGQPDCLLGEGAVWGWDPGRTGRGALVALTDVTLLTVGARSLAAVEAVSPSLAYRLRRGRTPQPVFDGRVTTHWREQVPAAAMAGGADG